LWKFQIGIYLKAKGLEDIMLKGKIDGTKIPNKPKKAETVKKEELADAKAQQIITSTVSKKCLMDLLSLKIS